MLFLLSPAKSLDYESPLPAGVARKATEPAFMVQAAELIGLLRPLKVGQIASLMDLSDKLARLNAARYAAWSPKSTAANSRPAVLAFNGDVYDG
ncbi:MAG: peroxide stress protein YaaA, partial [Betaproteobacteria bacterium]